MLVIGHDDLVDRGLHNVGAEALARVVVLTLDAGAMPCDIGELIDEQARVQLSGLDKTVVD